MFPGYKGGIGRQMEGDRDLRQKEGEDGGYLAPIWKGKI